MVDIDEADVAVLNQNLVKSKELFNSISKSLNRISNKSTNASNKIKPVLRDVNKLTSERKDIEKGIDKLKEVSNYAERTSLYETILNNSIEIIGLKKYIDTLNKSKSLLKEMKTQIKKFHGILINFENLIDKSEFKLTTFFKKQVEAGKFNDILIISNYFNHDNKQINKTLISSRSTKLMSKMKQVEASNSFQPKNLGPKAPPYEKKTNGIHAYTYELLNLLEKEYELLERLDRVDLFGLIVDHQMDSLNEVMQKNYVAYFNNENLVTNDILVLELTQMMHEFQVSFERFDELKKYAVNMIFDKLLNVFTQLIKEYFKFTETRIHAVEKLTELNSTELVVELITRVRKLSDHSVGLHLLISHYSIGEWLNIKGLRFIGVYTSVIKNDMEEPQLVSNFMSDMIDCIMVNIETRLKEFKKSTQGFYLIKNTMLIEGIISRSSNLYELLGAIGMERLNKLKSRFLKLFLDDWNYASYIIIRDMTQLTTLSATNQSSELSSKEKDQIKKLFETFNESFEEAVRNYEKFSISDPNLRNYLAGEIKKLIMNAYFKLYDKYGNSSFTKNKAKYIKYNKMQFESILNDRLR
ncbi:exocyst complex component exo70 [Yamadazyma tenuis]|uniref:Exocyst complex subunit Exo70 C-terminal domain-containing protein n=1 Tax=Candida tenuis (strain ATCC 10573 / BCRC 21748 / CBS 615 / JCM 9827 / NBRC 10315 / NRRL Y-1498 / VKM Y-70) TaxID=590646 RepID=G3B334_CANTC|nr:uncharacterized protein CANTEDRAFT_122135 [Yamadazyma tenuis ATCC 10573]EGV64069.1 hypothetical protein CANTEDRAFT_122135 [Yamadazyma tenuis ATCC 10573]WEJ96301.1 exocyst complex component exo70 [Yamadazyma tenuis]